MKIIKAKEQENIESASFKLMSFRDYTISKNLKTIFDEIIHYKLDLFPTFKY